MRTYKVQFIKYRKGQTSFERSITYDHMQLLLIMADDVKVKYKERGRTGEITFIFNGELNKYATVKGVPHHMLSKLIPPQEWGQHG